MEKKSSEKKYGVRKWAGGQWAVADGNTIVHVADTNEDAWRWIDKHQVHQPWQRKRKERV